MLRKIQLLVLTSLISYFAIAQKATITGTVKDNNGKPLSAATVSAKGVKNKTVTNADGSFAIEVENGTILTVSYIGFETAEVQTQGNTPLNIQLKLAKSNLEEVVVLGSRGVPRTKLESTVPVDVFDVKSLISDIPQTDLTGILNYVAPSFNSTP
jgi:iron complex outermembrane receptor protein